MKLYFFRSSQAANIYEAVRDGALSYVGEYETTTKGDEQSIAAIKQLIAVVTEACDSTEIMRFVEVSDCHDFYPLDKEHADE